MKLIAKGNRAGNRPNFSAAVIIEWAAMKLIAKANRRGNRPNFSFAVIGCLSGQWLLTVDGMGGRGLFQHLAPPLRLLKRLDWRGSWLPKSYFEATCTNAYTRGSTTDARYSVVIILNKYPINSDLEEGIWFYSLYYITIFWSYTTISCFNR